MQQKNTGGPAFPGTVPHPTEMAPTGAPRMIQVSGMTVRDYFAAHAPISMLEARSEWHLRHGSGSRQPTLQDIMALLALMRGQYASAMMAERGAE